MVECCKLGCGFPLLFGLTMPELVEVEIIKRQLEAKLLGKRFTKIEIKDPKIFKGDKNNILNSRITQIKRIGKILIICFENNFCLATHFKMSGRFVFEKESKNFNKVHNRAIFYLGKEKLIYNDIRRFGWLKVIKKDELKDLLKNLGTDALEISFEEFEKIIKNSSRMIKGLLMDQTKISGIGNIYANEILYLARINPKTKGNNLTNKQLKDLYKAITKVLKRALKFSGSSISSFITTEAQKGNYQKHFYIYGRANRRCPRDKGIIKKINLLSRATYFCPICQK